MVRKLRRSTCAVVGIGASAGGLDALRRLLGALPAEPPFAVVVVQHLDPTVRSQLAEIIERSCSLTVKRSRSGDVLTAGTVHVVPEGREAFLEDGRLRLRQRPGTCSEPIDALFTSLATHNESSGCGVLLSGNGADGVLGLREIRGAGGVTFAQEPSSAEYPSMPATAIQAGVCDFVGTPERIAVDLMAHAGHPALDASGPPAPARSKKVAAGEAAALARILDLVNVDLGLDFSGYKETTVLRRVHRRAMLRDAADIREYVTLVENDPGELAALMDDLLINVTQFFRDADVFEALRAQVLPGIIGSTTEADTLRIWVVGCSTGEEVYSLLITALEALEEAGVSRKVTVFGTDVSDSAIRRARAGIYPPTICACVSPERLSRYFVRTEAGFEIDRSLRDMCVFARQDITRDTPFSRLDMVSIRNVLIYMDQPLQSQVLAVAHFALGPEGVLLLGTSETPESEPHLFKPMDKQHHVYRRQDVASRLPVDVANATRASIDALSIATPALTLELDTHDSQNAANEMALLMYAPPRVVIDANGAVLHFFGDTSPFLEHPPGRATLDINEMAQPGVALELKDTLEAAMRNGGRATRTAAFLAGGAKRNVSIEVTPIPSPRGRAQYMVAFRDIGPEDTTAGAVTNEDLARLYETREQRVRGELGAVRGRIRAISEEKEQVNQSLRSANEEIRSSNEELQSINEELETAKEELQSANEELITVNDELRSSNRDLVLVNDDLTNFTSSLDVPVLMLDCSLRVRRFTPQATRVVHIEPSDVGRLLEHLRLRVDVVDLSVLASAVIESGEPVQREVHDEDDAWYVMTVRPYRSWGGAVDGVVIAFHDVDQLKRGSERLERRVRLGDAMTDIDISLASTMDIDEIMQCALDDGVAALGTDAGTIELREGDEWVVRYQNGFTAHEVGERLTEADAPNATETAHTASPVVITDIASNERVNVGFAKAHALRSVLGIPLVTRGTVTGSLLFYTRTTERAFDDAEVDFGRRLGTAVSLALENARLLNAERDATMRAETLNAINEIVRTAVTPDDLLARLVGEVSEVAGADKCLVISVNGDEYEVTHVRNVRPDAIGMRRSADYFPAFAWAATAARPVLIGDTWSAKETNKDFVVPYELRAFQLLPLIAAGEVVCVLAMAYDQPRTFDADDVSFSQRMSVAMSLALQSALLYESEVRAREEAKRELETSNLLLAAAAAIAHRTDPADVARGLAETLLESTEHARVIVSLYDEASRELVVTASSGQGALDVGGRWPIDTVSVAAQEAVLQRRTNLWDLDTVSGDDRGVAIDELQMHLALYVPLVRRDVVIGLLIVDDPGARREFSERDIQLIEGIAAQAAVAVEQARQFKTEVAAGALSQTLAEISARLTSTHDVDLVLTEVLHSASAAVGASGAILAAREGDGWRTSHVDGMTIDQIGDYHTDEGSPARRRVFETREPYLVADVMADPEADPGLAERIGYRSYAAYPLVYRDRVSGALSFFFLEPRAALTASESEFARRLVFIIAAAQENERLFVAEAQRARRMSVLRTIAEVAASSLSVEEVASWLANAVATAFGPARVLFTGARGERLVPLAGVGFPDGFLEGIDAFPPDSVSVAVYGSDGPLVQEDLESEDLSGFAKSFAQSLQGRSHVGLPLVAGSARLGTLSLMWEEPHAFPAEEIEFLESVAAECAIGLQNALLFESEKRAREDAKRELGTTALLLECAEALAGPGELGERLDAVAGLVSSALLHDRMVITLMDEAAATVRVAAAAGGPPPAREVFAWDDLSLAGRTAIETRATTVIDYAQESDAVRGISEKAGFRLAAAVPMVAAGRTVGLILADKPSASVEFSEREIELLESIAGQAATAVDNERLFQAERAARKAEAERAERTFLLKEIANLAASSLDTHSVGALVAEGVHRLLGADMVQLRLVNSDGTQLVSEALVDTASGFLAGLGPMPVGSPAMTAVCFRSKQACFGEDTKAAKISKASKVNVRDSGVRAYAVLPLLARGTAIGTFFVGWTVPRRFTADDKVFFETLADQFVVGLENARLFEAEQRSRHRVEALHELTDIATSSLELDEVARRALHYVHDELAVDVVTFWTLDRTRGRLFPVSGVGFPQEFFEGFAAGVGLDDPFEVATAVKSGQPIVRGVGHMSEVPEPVRVSYAKFDVDLQALLVLPVRGRADVIGAVTLAWTSARELGADEVQFFMSVANELAIATENAMLYSAMESELGRTRMLAAVATAASSSLGPDEICEQALEAVRPLPELAAAAVYVLEADGHGMRAAALFGYPDEMLAGIAELPVDDTNNPGRVAGHDLAMLTHEDEVNPPQASDRLARMGLPSARWILLPMRSAGRLLGVVGLTFEGERPFESPEVTMFSGIADTLATALANARLFDAEKAELARTSLLKEIASIGASALDPRELAARALGTIRSRTGAATGNFFVIDRAAGVLRSLASVGVPKKAIAAYREVPLAADTTSTRVALTGVPANHAGLDATGTGGRVAKLTGKAGWVVLPVSSRGTILGVLGLSFKDPRPFQPAELALYQSVSDQLGVALERTMLVEDLEASQQRVSSILESISDGFYVLDHDWRFTYANDEAGRMIGVPPEALIGRTIGEALGNPDVQRFQEISFGPAMNEGTVVELERLFSQTGIWADIRVYPSPEGVAVYGRDISGRKGVEAALQQARERADLMAALLDESSQPFIVGNLDGTLVLVNHAFERLTGYSAEDLADPAYAARLTPPEYAAVEAEQLDRLLRTGEPVRYEKEVARRGGARVPVEMLVHLASDNDGTPHAYYSFVTDLSERRERERLDALFSDVRTAIAETLDYATIIGTALARGAEAIGSDAADAFVRERGGWKVAASVGAPRAVDVESASETGIMLARLLAAEQGPLFISDAVSDPRLKPGFSRRHGIKSVVAVALGLPGAEVGFLAFYHTKKRDFFTPAQVEFAMGLARVVALAIQNSMLYERERNIAETLQEALLTAPEHIEGIDTAFVYRAASNTADVGGDFCEVFAIDERTCAIVVGDVSGKGIEAARLVSLLHDGIRAYALETSDPSEILGRLDRLVHLLSPAEQYATVFLGVLDTSTGRMKYCTAGHPAPALVTSQVASFLPGTRAPLLGAFSEASFPCREMTLAAGDRLVAFTDGVTESRRGRKFLGEEGLLKMLGKMTRTPVRRLPQRLFDHVLAFAGGVLRDDTVILALELTDTSHVPEVGHKP